MSKAGSQAGLGVRMESTAELDDDGTPQIGTHNCTHLVHVHVHLSQVHVHVLVRLQSTAY